MGQRFLSLWFRHLLTDDAARRRPALLTVPFVLAAPERGRMVVTAANRLAQVQGIQSGMVVADARVLLPGLEVLDDHPERAGQLLRAMALWCIRFTPVAAIDLPDGLILDISGCAQLWGGERPYLAQLVTTLRGRGYDVRDAIADTIGAARAVARYGGTSTIIEAGCTVDALLPLPVTALRLDQAVTNRLARLGLFKVRDIASMARQALRSRFGNDLLLRLDQAFGREMEVIEPVVPVVPYIERLPCLEPIATATGIGIALTRLLEALCHRLQQDGKGLRAAVFKGYRLDGKIVQAGIGTHRATHHVPHLFKLFEDKIAMLEPDLGIDLFTLEAPTVDDVAARQPSIWSGATGLQNPRLAELVDRVANRFGEGCIHRYVPAEHYWPERAFVPATSFDDQALTAWALNRPRPIHILAAPERIEVAAPIPDYPPMHFRHQGQLRKMVRAEGPERIEPEWWIDGAQHRDYYAVEDEAGVRYWIFRSGPYTGLQTFSWFLHGYFA
jgi:protein ImuB